MWSPNNPSEVEEDKIQFGLQIEAQLSRTSSLQLPNIDSSVPEKTALPGVGGMRRTKRFLNLE